MTTKEGIRVTRLRATSAEGGLATSRGGGKPGRARCRFQRGRPSPAGLSKPRVFSGFVAK